MTPRRLIPFSWQSQNSRGVLRHLSLRFLSLVIYCIRGGIASSSCNLRDDQRRVLPRTPVGLHTSTFTNLESDSGDYRAPLLRAKFCKAWIWMQQNAFPKDKAKTRFGSMVLRRSAS